MCQLSHGRCHVSHVMCHLSPVTCHPWHVTNANSHSHSPLLTSQYAQQDAAADVNLDPSMISYEDPMCCHKFTIFFAIC